jgi:hypothetical protein
VQVHDDDVRGTFLEHAAHAVAVRHRRDREAVGLEVFMQRVTQIRIVVDDQEMPFLVHPRPSACRI